MYFKNGLRARRSISTAEREGGQQGSATRATIGPLLGPKPDLVERFRTTGASLGADERHEVADGSNVSGNASMAPINSLGLRSVLVAATPGCEKFGKSGRSAVYTEETRPARYMSVGKSNPAKYAMRQQPTMDCSMSEFAASRLVEFYSDTAVARS